jgi:autotransporter translocation and assembly factor TamB
LKLKVSGTYAQPVIDAVLEARDLRSPEQPKLPAADLKFTLAAKDGYLSVDGSAIAPDFPAAVMTASMPFRPAEWAEKPELVKSEKLTARLDLPRIDLSRFASLVAAARKVSGTVTGNVELAGEVGKPAIKGRIDLANGGLELKDESRPPVTGIGASVDLALDRITLKNLKANVAGGSLQGGGSLAIDKGKPGALDFRITANHLPLLRNDSLIARANADLRLAGTLERAALTGTVGVVDSLFYRDIELLPIGTPFTAPSAAALPKIDAPANPAAAMPEPFRNWNLDVRVRTENPFLIRGNFATGTVDVNLRVGGTFGKPAPDGEVKISDFKAALPFSTLKVRKGTVRFEPASGFDPVLEIRGSAEPRPYRVSVFVYGRASNPQLVLTSNPPLPENEIMTLLATGTTTSGLENPQAASSRAMQLLAEELRRGRFAVGKRLRPLLGLLDRVDFSLAESDPYSSDSFSTATISLTDRWYLSAGMGAEGDSRVMGIWRLTFR